MAIVQQPAAQIGNPDMSEQKQDFSTHEDACIKRLVAISASLLCSRGGKYRHSLSNAEN